jgi:hypothetical protein
MPNLMKPKPKKYFNIPILIISNVYKKYLIINSVKYDIRCRIKTQIS